MNDVKEILQIKTSVSSGCPFCHKSGYPNNFDDRVNHYLKEHNFKLLHIGQETGRDDDGKPWHDTVAVVGTTKTLKRKPIPKIKIVFQKGDK